MTTNRMATDPILSKVSEPSFIFRVFSICINLAIISLLLEDGRRDPVGFVGRMSVGGGSGEHIVAEVFEGCRMTNLIRHLYLVSREFYEMYVVIF